MSPIHTTIRSYKICNFPRCSYCETLVAVPTSLSIEFSKKISQEMFEQQEGYKICVLSNIGQFSIISVVDS